MNLYNEDFQDDKEKLNSSLHKNNFTDHLY